MTIDKITKNDYAQLEKAFCDYYEELGCEDEPHHLFDEYLLPDLQQGLFEAAVAHEQGELCGFVLFQVDTTANEWCLREGDGDIREIYVALPHRNKGVGKSLLSFAMASLKANGAEMVFTLPTEECEKFFIECGFEDCGDYCAELDNKVFERIL